MQKFEVIEGIALPLDRTNIDTDAIIPQRWLVTVSRHGLGEGLFGSLRYDVNGHDQPDFILNQPAYQGARIIVAGANYGCGSSREHAVWAHLDYGVRAVIAPSFGPIFYGNSLNNGLLPVELPADQVAILMAQLLASPGARCGVDLRTNEVTGPDGVVYPFTMDAGRRQALLKGLDDIALTEREADRISAFQQQQLARMPWLA
ncbi:3-isopropylmalate dehydratase small subunit [Ottowia thiooxydans]|uniref:3-isopropylmalate dehydratase small subunit n=1 Tax=Ottowia thiooxydans TaxID=219182 RepID=UPI000415559E|nr:3-isopropylmalate dehydratase small subunit [Ottowia thiooxydans]